MFNTLPEAIQNSVLEYLRMNNFVEAKHVYDSWHQYTAKVPANEGISLEVKKK